VARKLCPQILYQRVDFRTDKYSGCRYCIADKDLAMLESSEMNDQKATGFRLKPVAF